MRNSKNPMSMSMVGNSLPINVNDNDIGGVVSTDDSKKADVIADKLVDMFGAPTSRKFFCLCAYKLSEAKIYALAEYSIENGRVPIALFIRLAKREM